MKRERGRVAARLGALVPAGALFLVLASASSAVAAPTNDDFADALELASGGGTINNPSVAGATVEPGEPHPVPSVWYRWQAPSTARFVVSIAIHDEGLGAPRFAIYRGDSLPSLSEERYEIPSYDSTGWSSSAIVTKGSVYHVALYGTFADGYVTELTWGVLPNPCTKMGTHDDDVLVGTSSADYLCGLGGDDVFVGKQGDDYFDGGSEINMASYEDAPRRVRAFLVPDSYSGSVAGWGHDQLRNISQIRGSDFDDEIEGAMGDSRLMGYRSENLFIGGPGSDVLRGGLGVDALYGWAGNDVLAPGAALSDFTGGAQVIDGGGGEDTLSYAVAYGEGCCIGRPRLVVDLLQGRVTMRWGVDLLAGIENAIGGAYSDELRGSPVTNVLSGGERADVLYGYAGDDFLYGDGGSDSLDGGRGTDVCIQGPGVGPLVACEA